MSAPAPSRLATAEPAGRAFWPDAWLRMRNRIYASPRFQRWAARFPLTRWVARRRASKLFDLCAGFVYSQILHAVVRSGLLTALQKGPARAGELGLPLSVDASERLLAAAATLELSQRLRDGRYALGARGAELLGNPAVSALIEHHELLYRDLADPLALLAGTAPRSELSAFWRYSAAPASESRSEGYSELMSASLSLVAEDVLEAFPFGRFRCLLDVAGGQGGFVRAVAQRQPELSLMLFDLPTVAERARERLSAAGLSRRVTVVGGDMLQDALPTGADLVSLVRVVHDHDDAQALSLLSAVRRALNPGGTLLIAEPMAGTRGAEAMGDAYFGFYLLAMGQGRPRRFAELRALALAAGFRRVRERKTRRPLLVRVLEAQL